MSAYIVNDDHINVLVSYFMQRPMYEGAWIGIDGEWSYLDSYEKAQQVAEILYSQNVRSVNERYDEDSPDEFTFHQVREARSMFTPAEIAKALDGLEYQSCETDDYDQTNAHQVITDMRKNLLSNLPEYDEADTWEITAVTLAERREDL